MSEVTITECNFIGSIRGDATHRYCSSVLVCVASLDVELKHAVCILMGVCSVKLCVCVAVCRSCVAVH